MSPVEPTLERTDHPALIVSCPQRLYRFDICGRLCFCFLPYFRAILSAILSVLWRLVGRIRINNNVPTAVPSLQVSVPGGAMLRVVPPFKYGK